MTNRYYETGEIIKLRVHTARDMIVNEVGEKGVTKIDFTAGTSGVEYVVHYDDGLIVQHRGNLGYEAMWSKKWVF